jgi:8-oxo-dGTP pyrophosphatase MutT (NUDIX family)
VTEPAIVAARPAATVVVVRSAASRGGSKADGPDAGGIEVLVLRRSAASRFAPGFVVFPGGAVEEGDHDVARRWFGTPNEAARACAVRELAEETGLVLTDHGLVQPHGTMTDDRAFEPPTSAQLVELARWVAPDFLSVRFDARFFAVEAGPALVPTPDGVEADRAWWATPGEVLEDQRAGTAQLMWPTFKMLGALSSCRSVRDVLALKVEQVPPPGVTPARAASTEPPEASP